MPLASDDDDHLNCLTDDQSLDCLYRLAARLDRDRRQPFLQACALALARFPPDQIGPGTVFRTARALQREFLTAPARHDAGYTSKYR